MKLQRAFTLIELLIVIAIIAILAAIAVPNFLEAQTRSKVSAVKSDMRTMGVALEAYRTDGAHYPPGLNPLSPVTPPGALTESWRLTTPIAYLTTIPNDRFYAEQAFTAMGLPDNEPGGPFSLGGPYLHYTNDPLVTESWLVMSYGPDRVMQFEQVSYDPSNGTISSGDIYRVGEAR